MANLIPQGGVFAGLDRLNQALDQRAQNAMAMSQMREQERRNALSEGYIRDDRERQLAEIQRQEMIRNAMSQPYTQQTGGPLLSQMGQDYQPVSLETMQPTRELVGKRLQGLGEWEQALKLMPESSQPEYQIIDGQYVPKQPGQAAMPIPGFQRQSKEPEFTIMQDANGEYVYIPKSPGVKPIPTGTKGKLPEAPKVSVTVDSGKREQGLVDEAVKGLNKMQEEARMANIAINRINQSLKIVEKGGNSVTGMSGAIKAGLAPFATAVGLNTQKMDDAQILQSLLKEGAGSLRMAVVGPGPVSNYEQGIMQAVSGQKISAAEGVKKILKHHKETQQSNIKAYNSRVKGVSKFKGYEGATELYPTINEEADADITWDN